MRLLNGLSKFDEIDIIAEEAGGGFSAVDSEGSLCFIPYKAVIQHGLGIGDKMTGALVQYRRDGNYKWFAEWVLPWRLITLAEVESALEELRHGGAIKACDIGVHAGDILYHAGFAQKIVGFDRKENIDPSHHVLYTIELDNVMNEIAEEYVDE